MKLQQSLERALAYNYGLLYPNESLIIKQKEAEELSDDWELNEITTFLLDINL